MRRLKTHGDATALHFTLPLNSPTLSAGNPLPLRGTKRVAPSEPIAVRRSKRDKANALAAAQDSIAPHLSRQTCSTLLRETNGSALDLALANWLMKDRVSSDHRPPTSPARTTKRARRWEATSSGYALSFRRLAALRANPSVEGAPGRADPSPWSGLTNVVSTASCAPSNKGSPSATTSSR